MRGTDQRNNRKLGYGGLGNILRWGHTWDCETWRKGRGIQTHRGCVVSGDTVPGVCRGGRRRWGTTVWYFVVSEMGLRLALPSRWRRRRVGHWSNTVSVLGGLILPPSLPGMVADVASDDELCGTVQVGRRHYRSLLGLRAVPHFFFFYFILWISIGGDVKFRLMATPRFGTKIAASLVASRNVQPLQPGSIFSCRYKGDILIHASVQISEIYSRRSNRRCRLRSLSSSQRSRIRSLIQKSNITRVSGSLAKLR